MIGEISRILAGFRSCFTRTAAFNWFVTVMFGFIVRIDLCGGQFLCALAGHRACAIYGHALLFPGVVLATGRDFAALVAHRTGVLSVAGNRRSFVAGRGRHQDQQRRRTDAGGQTVAPGIGQLRQGALYLWASLGCDRHPGRPGKKNSFASPFVPNCMKGSLTSAGCKTKPILSSMVVSRSVSQR